MRANQRVAVAATAAAVVAPMLAVHWVAESQGLFAQILSLSLWGAAIAAWAGVPGLGHVPWRALRPLLLALCGVALGIMVSTVAHAAPTGVWLGSLAVVLAAAGVAVAGASATGAAPQAASRALMWGLVITAFVSLAVAAVQLAAPGRAPAVWVAPAAVPGRASANLGQPNHLATLLVWAWLAVAAWSARGRDRRPGAPTASPAAPTPPPTVGSFLLTFALQAGVVATASRAGLLASLVIALWAALDRRLPRPTAWLLWITALGALAMTLGRALITPAASLATGASLVRPGARGGLFVDTLALIRGQPLSGVGWMEFQTAWSLSALGDRGPRYFEHAHNLVMGLLVELGVPLGAAICAALIWGALALLRRLGRVTPSLRPRALMLAAMLGVFGLHSLFDAPFLAAYLLLPAAWAWGCLVGLQAGVPDEAPVQPPQFGGPRRRAGGRLGAGSVPVGLAAGGGLLVIVGMFAWTDLRQALPLADTAAGGRLFGYFADARRALTAPDAQPELFRRARWAQLDTEMLIAWVASLERAGRVDEARYLTQRALEFRDPAHASWLAACRVVPPLEPPSRCQAPTRPLGWQEFR